MTSSERQLKPGQPRWTFDTPRYKDNDDVFFEKDLFSVLVIAYNRPEITRRCILSTLDCTNQFSGEVEWIFIENAGNDENYEFFQELDIDRKVVVRQKNYGINQALNQAWALSRGEWCFIHENDWECCMVLDYLTIVRDIMRQHNEIGMVQLRDPFDPSENHGLGKPEYSPWSCDKRKLDAAGINLWQETTEGAHNYLLSEFPNGFNNNPIVIRKSIYRECGPYPEAEIGFDPRHGETEYQRRVEKTGYATAHIALPLYKHIGRVQTQAQ